LANITLFCIQKTNKKQLSILIKGDFLHNILTLHKKAKMELPKPMGSLTNTTIQRNGHSGIRQEQLTQGLY
jgi:hypothetical protein